MHSMILHNREETLINVFYSALKMGRYLLIKH